MKPDRSDGPERKVVLTDGARRIVRPIVPGDKWALVRALDDLAEDSRKNHAMRRPLEMFGRKCGKLEIGAGIGGAIYEIAEPPGGFFDPSA